MRKGNETLLQRLYLLPLAGAAQKGGPPACLFTQNQVAEVLDGRRTPIYPAPFCPAWLKGCIQRAGVLAPVIDLDALCGPKSKAAAAPPRQLLVLRTGCPAPDATGGGHYLSLALTCRSAIETFRLTERDVAGFITADEPPEGFDWHGLAQGFFRLREHRVALLNLDPLAEGAFQPEKKGG